MASVSGSVESISINGRLFPVAADADTQRKLGGFENELQPNGDGSAREIKTRVVWMFGGLQVAIDEDRGDQEFLQDVADTPGLVPMAVTYASGKVYQGTGTITDEIVFSNQSATATINAQGSGKLTQQ